MNIPPVRPLPMALAACLANCKGGDQPRLELLNRIFGTMKPEAQMRCRAEIFEIKAAKRGLREARVS